MAGFNFEKNLPHQSHAVKATIKVFDGLEVNSPNSIASQHCNPTFDISGVNYASNIRKTREEYGVTDGEIKLNSNIIDIMMETGTGKTYTYTKTIFELNKYYGIFKFVIVVPTLPIKAGTIDFLKSDSAREHFKEQYNKTIQLHIVESVKNGKNKKTHFPAAVKSFVNSGKFEQNSLQVLVINAGMINSATMGKSFDTTLIDHYSVPFEAISATSPFMIIDEPHKFAQSNATWDNIKKMSPQYILRYGATFPDKQTSTKVINPLTGKIKSQKIKAKDYHNLIYTLSAVDAFNQNLVKGVIGHIAEFESGKTAIVQFMSSDGTEATFRLTENNTQQSFKLTKEGQFETIHNDMRGLELTKLNRTMVVLSNGLELRTGDKINPYSYAQTLQDSMISDAISKHFALEKDFLTRDPKIKPLTLFFIDNIQEYRDPEGSLRRQVEQCITAEVQALLKTETNGDYKAYLEQTLQDVSKTHGGYFSKDNSEKDEVIEQEVIEILHDKQAMLSLDNPRRFIFSKWTLREGWDNPNVFQICKLRSSGSDISKLQEVGRGLRLPVNEYGQRVKDEEFFLNYFVDFSENDFVENLVTEINQKSGAISKEDIPEELSKNIVKKICELYETTEDDLLKILDKNNVITRANKFKEGGFEYIKENFPLIFQVVGSNKIRKASDERKKISIRTDKYKELKALWEAINKKVILEYKIKNEPEFQGHLVAFLNQGAKEENGTFSADRLQYKQKKLITENNQADMKTENSINDTHATTLSTMHYDNFLKQLAQSLYVNITTLHASFCEAKIDINQYLNAVTIRNLKQKFDMYLLNNAINKFCIGYHAVTNTVHPTKLTNAGGKVLKEIYASDVGVLHSKANVDNKYFFDQLFYDSELEKQNIQASIEEVVVFTKIPKNSIKIPVAGGKSYSPDFAYVIRYKDGEETLHLIVETKGSDSNNLRGEEQQKIKHAEKFFDNKIKIEFKTQFSNTTITKLISDIINADKTSPKNKE